MDPAERAERHLEGLLPARRAGLQAEVDRAWAAVSRCTTPLQKYEARGLDAAMLRQHSALSVTEPSQLNGLSPGLHSARKQTSLRGPWCQPI